MKIYFLGALLLFLISTTLTLTGWTKESAKVEVDDLVSASRKGSLEVVKSILEKEGDLDVRNDSGECLECTALMVTSSTEVAQYLITKGIDVNATDAMGRTALMHASGTSNFQMAQLLIENGADVNAKDFDGKDVLDYLDLWLANYGDGGLTAQT